MKPIVIFRHVDCEGPAYLGQYLTKRQIPYEVVAIDQGQVIPADPTAFSGLVFMGGPMSVNDDLPWIREELKLIRAAAAQRQPILGHCLGGQLIAKALGGTVLGNPVGEIGWHEIIKTNESRATDWLEDVPEAWNAFHWHGERFSLPDGAIPLLTSEYCDYQAFSLDNILAMQCHVEMTVSLVATWIKRYPEQIANTSPSIQSGEAMLENVGARIAELNGVADRLYARWLQPITG